MELIRCADPEACAQATARLMADAIAGGARQLALSGGSGPPRVLELLSGLVSDWEDVVLWYGDERCVPPDDEDSNHKLCTEALDAPGAQWQRVLGELGPEEAALRYAQALEGVTIDVALNGMGPDGHTASLFPGHDAEIAADGPTVAVHDAPKPPPERVSMTLGMLNRSHRIVLLVTGEGKAENLAKVLAGPDPSLPASLLDRDALVVVADEAALAQVA